MKIITEFKKAKKQEQQKTEEQKHSPITLTLEYSLVAPPPLSSVVAPPSSLHKISYALPVQVLTYKFFHIYYMEKNRASPLGDKMYTAISKYFPSA